MRHRTDDRDDSGAERLSAALDRLREVDPARLREAVAFLRQWLPERAKTVYRSLIAEDPKRWRAHPHFAGGIIVEHALRGNGITEKALGVADLEEIWPDLLELALENDPPLPDAK